MNDIESRLGHEQPPKPRRPLSDNFTEQTMQRVRSTPRSRMLFTWLASHIKGALPMHKLSKRVAFGISLAAVVAVGGTTFAAITWMQPDVHVDQAEGITTLANGDKRFWVDFSSCQGQDMTNSFKQYYEIKAGSKVTPQDLAEGLTAQCEADLLPQLFPQATSASGQTKGTPPGGPNFKPHENQYFFPYAQFNGYSNGRMQLTSGLNGVTYHASLPVDKDAAFYEKGKKIALSDLKPGDFLTLVVHTTALTVPYSTETMRPDDLLKISKNGFPIGASVQGAIKHATNPIQASQLMGNAGQDWTSLLPDKNVPGGWKQETPLR